MYLRITSILKLAGFPRIYRHFVKCKIMYHPRAEAKESDGVMSDLKEEIERLRRVNTQAPVPGNEDPALQKEIQVLTQEKQALEAKLAAIEDEMRRNTIEKEFIEERFIGLS